ncbi:MAG: metallophosphoesterase [Microthrixaceae bacterium]
MSGIRIAAVGDIHVGLNDLVPDFSDVADLADMLLLAGDLTRRGTRDEAERLAELLASISIPVVAVLGNHDHHSDAAEEVSLILESAGARVLEQSVTSVTVGGAVVGIAGAKGFGGGMAGVAATAFGEPEMKAFALHGAPIASAIQSCLASLDTDLRILLLHYSPVRDTLEGEPPEIHAFLGDYRLAEVADHAGCDLILHGHAHRGRERGRTPGGIPVRNVARPVIRAPYRVFEMGVQSSRDRAPEFASLQADSYQN